LGDLEGSIIIPLIVNFTVDGLEERITTRQQQIIMINFKRMKWMKGKGHKSLFFQTQKTTLVRFINYVDNFVIIINNESWWNNILISNALFALHTLYLLVMRRQ